ncbi:MAG: tRNA lysidine(34) synthetase TilS [bacterium]
MIRAFSNFVSRQKLCQSDDNILVAVSGGPDSIVLLDLMIKSGYKVAIAHCNFKLRGKESNEDEKFVKDLGKKRKVKTFTRSFQTRTYANKMKLSVQEAARSLRYNWFEELAWSEGFDKIALGHHQDDLIETFFINLFRGSGIKGLKSIPVQRDKIIRPLMFAGRDQIINYCKKNRLPYRTDSSNDSEKYLRNTIRSRLLPVVDEIKPSSARKSMLQSIRYIIEDYSVYQQLMHELRTRRIMNLDESTYLIEDVHDLDPAMFYHLVENFGFDRKTTDAILVSLHKGSTGKEFLSSSYRLLIDRDRLLIRKKTAKERLAYTISEKMAQKDMPLNLTMKTYKKIHPVKFSPDPNHAYFDLQKVTFPLSIRKWKKGDRMVPFGMKGSKLISDLLTDKKLSRFKKEDVWVMLSGKQIIWVIGIRSSNLTRVSRKTDKILEFNWKGQY